LLQQNGVSSHDQATSRWSGGREGAVSGPVRACMGAHTVAGDAGDARRARTEGVIAAQHASNFNRRGYCCAARVLLK